MSCCSSCHRMKKLKPGVVESCVNNRNISIVSLKISFFLVLSSSWNSHLFFSWASRIYLWRHWYVVKISSFKSCSHFISWRKANLARMDQPDRQTEWDEHIPMKILEVSSSALALFITITSSLCDNKLMLYSHCAEEANTGSSPIWLSFSIGFYYHRLLAFLA